DHGARQGDPGGGRAAPVLQGRLRPQVMERTPMSPLRIAVLTVSDGVAAGTRSDGSGAAIRDWIMARGSRLAAHETVPDGRDRIVPELCAVADRTETDLILTTGGNGFTAADTTPKEPRAVITREVPANENCSRQDASL